ncbi:MAG: alpha-hydroxy-acid oxidizing protein [Gammaproteobacteria bacterium]|nr:alpha-hydroxy-acid oxidizing protein [Gammaproteobacteria bacterium]
MTADDRRFSARRALLRYLAASPAMAGLGGWTPCINAQEPPPIESAEHVLNVFEMHDIARKKLNAGHYAYMAQSADDSAMLRINRAGFRELKLRPRRLVDGSALNTGCEIFGQHYDLPVFLSPCGALEAFDPAGEVAAARAAKSANALQILSTVANRGIEEVTQAREAPLWFQLYPSDDWTLTRRMIKRAEDAGSVALALTVDIPARNLEGAARFRRDSNPVCLTCHAPQESFSKMAMFAGAQPGKFRLGVSGLTWDYVDRLKDTTSMKLLVKGIVTGEDTERCLLHGADGVIVSNHGGRAEDSGRSTIECLPEVVAAAGDIPVFIDSGFRRGTDIIKALALGATAVGIGKPYLWGLGAFGQRGVERVLAILERELRIVMEQMGTPTLAAIASSASIVTR